MRVLLSILIVFIGLEGLCQVQQPNRFEVELGDQDEMFSVINANNDGLFLFREVKNTETKKERKWQIVHLDSTLTPIWQEFYFFDLVYIFRGHDYSDGYLYLLFESYLYNAPSFMVVKIDPISKMLETFIVDKTVMIELEEFEVINNSLVFAGYVDTRPTVLCYKYGKKEPIVVPGFYTEKSYLIQLHMDDESNTFTVLTSQRTLENRKTISVKSFDENGRLIKDYLLQPSDKYNLLYGRAVNLSDNIHLIIGTYSEKKSEYSRGIFIARMDSDGSHVINYYNYAHLKNFFSFMKAKREARIKDRIERREVKGKKLRFNYRLLVNEVIEQDGRYIMVGEAFYPKYSNSNYYAGNYYAAGPSNYSSIFEGYKYTHAVVVGFDRRGRLIWDNSFEINDIINYSLVQNVQVTHSQGETVLLYVYENVIRSKIVSGSEVLEGKAFNDIQLKFEDDLSENDESDINGLDNWYGDFFYTYGIQDIKNTRDSGVKLSRNVFFINKVFYQ